MQFFWFCFMYVLATAGTGYLSYSWIEPASFGGVILFLIIWGILGKLATLLVSVMDFFGS